MPPFSIVPWKFSAVISTVAIPQNLARSHRPARWPANFLAKLSERAAPPIVLARPMLLITS